MVSCHRKKGSRGHMPPPPRILAGKWRVLGWVLCTLWLPYSRRFSWFRQNSVALFLLSVVLADTARLNHSAWNLNVIHQAEGDRNFAGNGRARAANRERHEFDWPQDGNRPEECVPLWVAAADDLSFR